VSAVCCCWVGFGIHVDVRAGGSQAAVMWQHVYAWARVSFGMSCACSHVTVLAGEALAV
jgi:hypothetical protein